MRGDTPLIRTYLSYDTPHRGANVPLSVQYFLDYMHVGNADAAEKLTLLVNSEAAREACFYHYTDWWRDSAAPRRDGMRTALLTEYARMAENGRLLDHVPQRCAISNGNVAKRFPEGTLLGVFNLAPNQIGSGWLGDGEFRAIGSGVCVIDVRVACVRNRWQANIGRAVPLDGMGGGTKDFISLLLCHVKQGSAMFGLDFCSAFRPVKQPVCFIPCESALDRPVGGVSDPLEEASRIAFTRVFTMDRSTPHLSINVPIRTFVMACVRG
jgi:hypothetical protein